MALSDVHEFNVPKHHELRVKDGRCELFGAELEQGRKTRLPPQSSVALHSFSGCKVELQGMSILASKPYVVGETPMLDVAQLHARLTFRRREAASAWEIQKAASAGDAKSTAATSSSSSSSPSSAAAAAGSSTGPSKPELAHREVAPVPAPECYGPRVMIVGGTDTGKSTLARTLATYAARLAYTPVLVDLDPGQGGLSLPGTVAAAPIDASRIDPTVGFTGLQPLVHCTASTTPDAHTNVYRGAVKALASSVRHVLLSNDTVRASGCIINTCGWTEGKGYSLLLKAIAEFEPDVIVVMVGGALLANLSSHRDGIVPGAPEGHGMWKVDPKRVGKGAAASAGSVPGGASSGAGLGVDPGASAAAGMGLPGTADVAVKKMAASDGVHKRSREQRRTAREQRITRYFFGPSGPRFLPLSPAILDLKVSEILALRLNGETTASVHLAVGEKSMLKDVRSEVVDIEGEAESIVNDVWAVSLAPPDASHDELHEHPVAGFVQVLQVDAKREGGAVVRLRVPNPGPLPSKLFLVTGQSFVE